MAQPVALVRAASNLSMGFSTPAPAAAAAVTAIAASASGPAVAPMKAAAAAGSAGTITFINPYHRNLEVAIARVCRVAGIPTPHPFTISPKLVLPLPVDTHMTVIFSAPINIRFYPALASHYISLNTSRTNFFVLVYMNLENRIPLQDLPALLPHDTIIKEMHKGLHGFDFNEADGLNTIATNQIGLHIRRACQIAADPENAALIALDLDS